MKELENKHKEKWENNKKGFKDKGGKDNNKL